MQHWFSLLLGPLICSPTFSVPIRSFSLALYQTASNVDAAVTAYLQAGIPGAKIVVGVPFYGMGWEGVANTNHGLYQPLKGLPHGTWGDDIYDYRDLETHYFDTYQRFWNADTQTPWLYSPQTQIMISYEDPQSINAKVHYVKQHSLGGVMIWELDYDNKVHLLLGTITQALR